MKNTNAASNFYSIGNIVQFTGLSDRTIRNYISAGLLAGEKVNGVWQFSQAQVDTLLGHPAVRSSILAKQNGIVCDFLLNTDQNRKHACIILDLPNEDPEQVGEFFCNAIRDGDFQELQFSFSALTSCPRVILEGDIEAVLQLANQFNSH